MDYGPNESWNIARDQEKKSLLILWPNFQIIWLENAQIHNLTQLNTLASDCLNSSHFSAKQENFEWLGCSSHGKSYIYVSLCQLCLILTFIVRLGLSSQKMVVLLTKIKRMKLRMR